MSFNLFDRTPHVWAKVVEWSSKRKEFEKRTAFALLWSLTMHDKRASDEQFIRGLALIEREAIDERNFVNRQTQSRAQYSCRGGGAATLGLRGFDGEVGGQGCVAGAYESWSEETDQGMRDHKHPRWFF